MRLPTSYAQLQGMKRDRNLKRVDWTRETTSRGPLRHQVVSLYVIYICNVGGSIHRTKSSLDSRHFSCLSINKMAINAPTPSSPTRLIRPHPPSQSDLHTFLTRHLHLLAAERQAEIDQTSLLASKCSVKQLEKRGLAIGSESGGAGR